MRWPGLLEAFKEFLPINPGTPKLTLNEGNTPLIKLERLSKEWDVELYVKMEGANPTGSFKDRGMVMAVAKAMEEGSKTIICASTGKYFRSSCSLCGTGGLKMYHRHPGRKNCHGETCAGDDVRSRNYLD